MTEKVALALVRLLQTLMCLMAVVRGGAAPAHLIRFSAVGPRIGCAAVVWRDAVTMFNTTNTPATVRVVGISNGGTQRTDHDTFEIPPGTALDADVALRGAWTPKNGDPLWVMHLDVPEGIIIESRDEIVRADACIGDTPSVVEGKVSLPVFRAIVPSGERQVYVGTDVGSRDARINVGIYNAGSVSATAHIEVRRGCDNLLVDTRDVTVPADTIMQFTGLAKGSDDGCGVTSTTPQYVRYTVVTVSQPSITYVVALSDTRAAVITPQIGVSVPTNFKF